MHVVAKMKAQRRLYKKLRKEGHSVKDAMRISQEQLPQKPSALPTGVTSMMNLLAATTPSVASTAIPAPPQPHDQQQHLRSLFFQGSSFSIERVLKKFSATCAQQKWYDQHYSTLQNCAKQFNGLFLQLHT